MLDTVTIERIKQLHPKLRKEALDMYTHANEVLLGKGVRLRFAYTYRSPEEQTELYAQGRTKKGSKVTNAPAWSSFHQYGVALDIVLLVDKDGNGTFETATWDTKADFDKDREADWMEVTNYFKSKGWKWGGDFTSITDKPHFEKTFGYTVKQLKDKIDKKDYIVENGIKYVNL